MWTDADLLSAIRAMGGVRVRAETGEFWALFDNERQAIQFETGEFIDAGPRLTAVTADVEACAVRRGSLLQLPAGRFRAVDLQPDGKGQTVVRLELP